MVVLADRFTDPMVIRDHFPRREMQILLVRASFGVVRPARAEPRVWKQFGASGATKRNHRTRSPFDIISARHETNAKGN
jgi:hypothetical protein